MPPLPLRDQRRNVVVNLLDGGAWLFGISFMSATTILPVFLRHLTGSPVLIGLVPALLDMGWFLPQLFIAPYVQGRKRQYGLVLGLGLIERLPFILLPLLLWLAPGLTLPGRLSLAVFFGLLLMRALGAGFVAPAWQELIARLIPVRMRGRFFSYQQFVGNLLALGGAALAGLILQRYPYPTNFILSFSIGAVGIMLSWVCLALSREPDLDLPPPAHQQFNAAYVRRLQQILRADHNFRAFLMSRACAYLGTMPMGFLAVALITRFSLSDAQAGVFNTWLILGGSVGNLLWGAIADRIGYKVVLYASTTLWMLALALALVAPGVALAYVVFAMVGIATAGTLVADLGMVMEFGTEAERPTYIGLGRSVTAPFLAIAPLLGGFIAQVSSYAVLMLAALPFAALSVYLLQKHVREPRLVALSQDTA